MLIHSFWVYLLPVSQKKYLLRMLYHQHLTTQQSKFGMSTHSPAYTI